MTEFAAMVDDDSEKPALGSVEDIVQRTEKRAEFYSVGRCAIDAPLYTNTERIMMLEREVRELREVVALLLASDQK
jgi:hypothetical protein